MKKRILPIDCKHNRGFNRSDSSGFIWLYCRICNLKKYQYTKYEEKKAMDHLKELNKDITFEA